MYNVSVNDIIVFTQDYLDSCTAIALQIALDLEAKDIFVIGYDGYKGEVLSEKEMDLTNENRTLFTGFVSYFKKPMSFNSKVESSAKSGTSVPIFLGKGAKIHLSLNSLALILRFIRFASFPTRQ